MSPDLLRRLQSPQPGLQPLSRRGLLVAAGAGAACAWLPAATLAQGQAFPTKPVRLLVGFGPGTGPDVLARLLAERLAAGWGGVGVVVDNKPGAAGLLSIQELKRAPPDGHTLLLATAAQLSIAPSTYTKLPYDPDKDLAPVSQVADSDLVLLVNPQKSSAASVQEYVAWLKQRKNFFMGTFGAGTVGHFGAFVLGDAVGVKPDVVHYRTTADAIVGLVNGDVQGTFTTVSLAAAQVQSGKLVALASTGKKRAQELPQVPTFAEAGLPGISFSAWFGVVAPAGTPAPLVSRLSQDIQGAVKAGEARIREASFGPLGTTAPEFKRVIDADTKLWAKAVAASGFKADK